MGLMRLAVTFVIAATTASLLAGPVEPKRQVQSLDRDWKFNLGDVPGAEAPAFSDSAWRALDVPHDWSIEGPFAETNPTGGAGAFLPAGIGWYRKQFTLPQEMAGRKVFVEFDGVMANSDVWINGVHLGKRPFGYVGFRYELTAHLQVGAGKTNVLAVRADNAQQPASRWYSGAGIYRHVRLIATDAVHIEPWGVFVSTPKLAADQATVRVQIAVTNQSDAPRKATVRLTILSPDGQPAAEAEASPQTVAGGKSTQFQQEIVLKNPLRWDIEHPMLYRAVAQVRSEGITLDEDTVSFGIRDARFEPDTGFWLNGKNFKLKGVCLHQDAGGLGVAVPLGVWERRLGLLKQLGVNAIRTSHNPMAPEFLDLCDRMGFLVMDEMFDCWTAAKRPFDYHLYFNDWSHIDTRDTVRRDRNHPSVVIYSVGNEIRETKNAAASKKILSGLIAVVHENDPTRPVTQALFRPNASHDYDNGLADLLDVVGQNYRENEILAAHQQKPSRKILGTENGADRKTWLMLRDNAAYAGQFLWTGIDYLGESRRWPVVGYSSGLLDRTGEPKPHAYERQSWWSDKPMVYAARRVAPTELLPTDPGYGAEERHTQVLYSDWTVAKPSGRSEIVEVYSNCPQVELILNGRSLGSQDRPADASPRTWKVPFEPGTLKAVGKNGGQIVATHELRTAGKAAAIVLTTDRATLTADWDDISCVKATIVDDKGVIVPDAHDVINFKISGPGVIAAVDNADNSSHEPFQASSRHVCQGMCVAMIKATAASGPITLTASAPGLSSGSITIEISASKK